MVGLQLGCEETTAERTSFREPGWLPHCPRGMKRRDRELSPAQQLCPLHQPLPGISMCFWLSRRAARRLQPSSLLCFADNQLGNAETLLCWSIVAEHCSRSSQRIRAVRKSCQRAANPYNFFLICIAACDSKLQQVEFPGELYHHPAPLLRCLSQSGSGRCH